MIRKIPSETLYYHFHNENPKDRKTGDCAIRAISFALSKGWDEVIDEMLPLVHKHKQMFDYPDLYTKYLKQNGYIQGLQPKHPDNTKFTGEEFCRLLDKIGLSDPVVIHIGTHHTSVVAKHDGKYKVHDIWNCSKDKIGIVFLSERDIQIWYHADKRIYI